MTEAQKYQKKKNTLIIMFMFLLVVFVGLMCFIVLRAKLKPLAQPIDPESIEIKEVVVADYPMNNSPLYSIIRNSKKIIVTDNDEEYEIALGEDKKIKILRNETEEDIQIMLNNTDVNQDIKLIYSQNDTNVILTEAGNLYKINDTVINNNQLSVYEVMEDTEVKDIIYLSSKADAIHILDSQDKIFNIEKKKEYMGIISEIKTGTSTIYVYENNAFGLEEGKVFLDDNNQMIELSLSFDNKIIGVNNIVYEINSTDNKLYTSKLGEFQVVGYNKNEDDGIYNITVRTNTGSYELKSNYYYTK